ncbi:MAG: alpha/beta hydrolase-fold protein [Negativicutes bacterium]|jgi:predicted alpha/beta superfamily hydrolase
MSELVTRKVLMRNFNRTRTVNISLPSNYNEPGRRFPVIYVLDGESALAATAKKPEWSFCYDLTVDKLVAEEKFSGAIIVAVESANEYKKLFEKYTYPRDNEYSFDYGEEWHGWGDEFGNWLAYELKPYIDANFRTMPMRNYTGLFGSSLSATYAIWAALKYPHIFSKVAAFSPGVSFSDGSDMASFKVPFAKLYKPNYRLKIYMEVGTTENVPGGSTSNEKYLQDVLDFYNDYLGGIGFELGEDVLLNIVEEGNHTTECWQKNVVEAIAWLM